MAARTGSCSAARAVSLLASCACSACTWSSTFRTSPLRAQPAVSPRLKISALRAAEIVATARDFELGPAVLRPGALIVPVHQRPLLAPRLRLDAAGIDPVAHEVRRCRLRPEVPEAPV